MPARQMPKHRPPAAAAAETGTDAGGAEQPRRHQITLHCGPIQPVAQNHRRTSLQPTALGHQVQHGIGDFLRLKQTGAGRPWVKISSTSSRPGFSSPVDHLVGRRVVDHRGVHAGRQHRVDRDAIFGHLVRQRCHQCHHAGLGRGVMAGVGGAGARDDRGGRDDVAPHDVGAFASEREGMHTPYPRAPPVIKAALPSSAPIPIPTRRCGPGTGTTRAGKTPRHHRSHHATRVSQSLAGNTPKRCRRTLFSLANEFNALTGKSFL